MANLIQIKRSNTAASPSPSSNNRAGEFAYSYYSNSLFIGAQSGVSDASFKIAGAKYGYVDNVVNPGELQANAVIVVDSNSFISNTFTQGLVITPSGVGAGGNNAFINVISSFANATVLGVFGTDASNNELVTSWAIKTYVDQHIAASSNPQGSNGQFQYNDSNVLAGTSNMTYNKDTGSVTVGNTSSHVHLGYISDLSATQENQANQNNYVQIVGQNSNTGPSASFDVALYNDDGSYNTFIDMGINSSGWSNTLWTINGANDGYIYTGGGNLAIGTNAANKVVKLFTGGTLSTNERVRIDDSNTTIYNNLVLNGGLYANGTLGSNGYFLVSNGTAAYWAERESSNIIDVVDINVGNTVTVGNATVNAAITSNATATYFTGTAYYANSALYANNADYAYGKSEGDLNVNSASTATTANNSTYAFGKSEGDLNVNSASSALTSNNSTYAFGKSEGDLNVNSAASAVNANNASYLNSNTVGDIVTAAVANTVAADNVFTGNNTFQGSNVYISSNLTVTATESYISSNLYITASNTNVNSNFQVNGTQVQLNANVSLTGANVYINGNTSFDGYIDSDLTPTSNGVYSLGSTGQRWDKLWLTGATIELGNSSISDTSNGVTISNLQVTANAIIANIVGTTTNISSNLNITAANVDMTSAMLRVNDIYASGNLVINGTLTTINTNSLVVKDNMVIVAANNTSDTLDSGFYVNYGSTNYAGLARDHSDGVFKLFTTTTEPSTTADFTTLGTLAAYLKSGALVSNTSNVQITANSTVGVNFVANTLTLSTALAATSGGTGRNTYTSQDLLVANSSNGLDAISVGSEGYVLQVSSGLVSWNTLDGGTF